MKEDKGRVTSEGEPGKQVHKMEEAQGREIEAPQSEAAVQLVHVTQEREEMQEVDDAELSRQSAITATPC